MPFNPNLQLNAIVITLIATNDGRVPPQGPRFAVCRLPCYNLRIDCLQVASGNVIHKEMAL